MTLFELINQQLATTVKPKIVLTSLDIATLKSEETLLKQALTEELINTWIEDGLLAYSRKTKNHLIKLLELLEVSEVDKVLLITRFEERKGKLSFDKNTFNHNINFKSEVICIKAPDGEEIQGVLAYSKKDYILRITKPFEKKCGGGHLMYAAPVIYSTKPEKREGVKELNLLELAKETLLQCYKNRYLNQDVKLVSFRFGRPKNLEYYVKDIHLELIFDDLARYMKQCDKEDFDSKLSILKQQCKINEIELNEEALNYIANNTEYDVDALEHNFSKLYSYSKLMHQSIDLAFTKKFIPKKQTL